MAALASRQEFHDYILRRLGYPVIDIDVDPEQIEDRIDDALQKFQDYHFDGTEHVYHRIVVSATDIVNKYFTLPESLIGVTRIFQVGGNAISSNNLFNLRYQIHLNDLFSFASSQITPYVMAMRHIETIQEVFVGQQPIRFNRHMDRLYVELAWDEDVAAGDYIIVDGYAVLDPQVWTDVWNDQWLKKYATALVKKQWGGNLAKFSGMQLPGGVTFDGVRILQEATQEVEQLEKEVINDYSLPVFDMIG